MTWIKLKQFSIITMVMLLQLICDKMVIAYSLVQKYIKQGKIIRIRRGFYQWHKINETNEAATIAGLFPDGILCMDTALFYYGYSNRTPSE